MRCINCGFQSDDWEDVTMNCFVRIALTADIPLGYMILHHNGYNIGSIHLDGTISFYTDNAAKNYRFICQDNDKKLYFRVYRRKNIAPDNYNE